MIINVYVDGFNLYYRALRKKGTDGDSKKGLKWLDINKLCTNLLLTSSPKDVMINEIHYYTAHVSGKTESSPRDQQVYLNALSTSNKIKLHFGSFQVSEKWMPCVNPLLLKPTPEKLEIEPEPVCVKIIKTEEKGSDVNLGVHLVRDALLKRFDKAVVITNDGDLVEAIKIVIDEAKLPVVLLSPCTNIAYSLKNLATETQTIKEKNIKKAQFPDEIIFEGKLIKKPEDW